MRETRRWTAMWMMGADGRSRRRVAVGSPSRRMQLADERVFGDW